MPRKAKTAGLETEPAEAAQEQPRGAKTAAVRNAVKANPQKGPKEIAEMLRAEGWDVKASYVSIVKTGMKKGKKKAQAATEAAAEVAAAPAVPKDAVSLASLQKAKKLVQELGGVASAKQALNALGQLLD